jgi:stearoyl-CoA 9-desaturase NADPH oxidoreductase
MSTIAPVSKPVAAARRVSSWLTHLGVSEFAFDDTLQMISPLLTVHRMYARIVNKITETPSACTLVLQTGPAFEGMRAGQFMMIGVEVNGVRHRRAYSPRAVAGRPGQWAITVQRQANGKVSNHVHDKLHVGDVIEIEAASGEFTLPQMVPAQLLMIAGGSGITPIMSMLEHLHATGAKTAVTLLYFARSEAERIFARPLQELAARWPALQYVPLISQVNGTAANTNASEGENGVLNSALLDQYLSNWQQTRAYCCGPAPLMDAARAIWAQAQSSSHLQLEAFAPAKADGDPNTQHHVHIARGKEALVFDAPGNKTLLEAGESSGHAIKHGCRQGICHECTCRLNTGVIKDLSTGEEIHGQGQVVRLCVTTALSDLDMTSLN